MIPDFRRYAIRCVIFITSCTAYFSCQNLSIDTNSGGGSGVLGKSGNNVPVFGPNSPVGENHCATYPTSFISYSGATPTAVSTTVDTTNGKLNWIWSYLSGGSSATTTYAYESIKAFVQERHVSGSRHYSGATFVQGAVTAWTSETYTFDGLGRIAQIVVNASPYDIEVISGYDTYNRMTSSTFTRSFSGSTCSNIIGTYQYSVTGEMTTMVRSFSLSASIGTGAYVGTPCTGGAPTGGTYYYYTYNLPVGSNIAPTILGLSQVCY